MKNTFFIAILILQAACSSIPHKDGEASYSSLNKALIAINSVNHKDSNNYSNDKVHQNLIMGINKGWPELKLIKNTESTTTAYGLDIEILSYNATFDESSSVETVSNEKRYYDIYKTETILRFKYNMIDSQTNKVIWSKEIKSIDVKENKIQDYCRSSNILEDIACDFLIKPIVDAAIDVVFSTAPSSKKHPPATQYNDMFITAGRDIAKSLPDPRCSSDGYSICIAHFFRNTLGF